MNLERAITQPRIGLSLASSSRAIGPQVGPWGDPDPGQDVCQIDLRIVAVQFDRFDDGQDVGDALTALIRAGEEPIFPSNSHPPFILPMSAMKWKFITVGIRISVRRCVFVALSGGRQVSFSGLRPDRCRDRDGRMNDRSCDLCRHDDGASPRRTCGADRTQKAGHCRWQACTLPGWRQTRSGGRR